ncbi:hypothetical protein GCU56_17960 [Geodermatophilus sabuli]|uniref:Lipoprotein n=1 Tax=Geodermatophilus sabuli TaxID=1564158 RepID=A0A7K3W5V0_9ACTN|nr:hypothetical protein [Geodermatophilus sabuli]NEK59743.1 hypothetical protein [Geodermatophilus sabuli]
MRSPVRLFRSAVAGAAAVVVLTACGGSGDEDPAASSSASSSGSSSASSSAPSSTPAPDPAAAEFCTQVSAAFQELSTTLGTATPTEVAGRLPEVVATLESVQAPADIAPDWNALIDGLRQLATTAGSLDLTTPEGQQQFSDAEAQLTAQLGTAQTNLTSYVVANCSLAVPTPTG